MDMSLFGNVSATLWKIFYGESQNKNRKFILDVYGVLLPVESHCEASFPQSWSMHFTNIKFVVSYLLKNWYCGSSFYQKNYLKFKDSAYGFE